jgi:hypothetical protein
VIKYFRSDSQGAGNVVQKSTKYCPVAAHVRYDQPRSVLCGEIISQRFAAGDVEP